MTTTRTKVLTFADVRALCRRSVRKADERRNRAIDWEHEAQLWAEDTQRFAGGGRS